MKKYNKITPEGTKDFIFEECAARELAAEKLLSLFMGRGYNQVTTPGLEFLDVFGSLPLEDMYKLTDPKGRLMVLRADTTLPMARVAATRLKNQPLPLRLCYKQNVYTVNRALSGRSDEVFQAGVELIGSNSKRADLEVILLAVEGLKRCEAPDFKVEIGHAGFFKALSKELCLNDEQLEEIRMLIELKNYAALKDYLSSLDNEAAKILYKLPRLFGSSEVFDNARGICRSDEALKILDYLKALYNDLCAVGLSDNIIVDMGLVQRNDYYTGVIFRGFMSGSGETVMSGGRYDKLLEHFGEDLEATGFGINVDTLSKAGFDRKLLHKTPDVLVFGHDGYEAKAIVFANDLQKKGLICETSTNKSREEALEYAKGHGIKEVFFINDGVKSEKL